MDYDSIRTGDCGSASGRWKGGSRWSGDDHDRRSRLTSPQRKRWRWNHAQTTGTRQQAIKGGAKHSRLSDSKQTNLTTQPEF